jgi:hypothetical protein
MASRFAGVVVVVALFGASCSQATTPSRGTVEIAGVVRYMALEGGFWIVAADDGVTYDPHESLPARFRDNGRLVRMTAQLLPEAGCIHMVGPIIEITRIQ